eukprot:3021215-Prymnesium_polylepis.1
MFSYYLVVNIRFTTDLAERIMFSYNLVEMRYPGMTCVLVVVEFQYDHANRHTGISPVRHRWSPHTPTTGRRMSNTQTSDLIDDRVAKRQRADESGVVPGVPVEDTDGLRAVEKVVVENVNTTTTT